MRDELKKDSRLLALAGEIGRRSHVVAAALSLGMVRLRMANELTGEARDRMLARAESAFLSVRNQAEGRPEFHLGLGQVYFRLGKAKEGEQELARVLAEADPKLRLAVAGVYRDLGMTEKTIEVAEKVWNETSDPVARSEAASLLSVVATEIDEEEKWLSRADQTSPFVRRALMSVRAQRKQEGGDMAGADELYAAVADEYGAEAATDGTSANNAAVAEGPGGSPATGDIRRLEKAASYMTQAYRLSPESAIVAGNLVEAWQHLALTRVASHWLDLRVLRPEAHEVLSFLGTLADGPERAAVRERLTGDAAYRRSAALRQQWQILAPQHGPAYDSEYEMLGLLDDDRGMLALRGRLESATINPSPHRQEWLSGARDESRRKDLARWSARHDKMLARDGRRQARAGGRAAVEGGCPADGGCDRRCGVCPRRARASAGRGGLAVAAGGIRARAGPRPARGRDHGRGGGLGRCACGVGTEEALARQHDACVPDRRGVSAGARCAAPSASAGPDRAGARALARR